MCYFGCEKKKDFVWFNCHGFPVSPGEKKNNIKAIQICYIKAALAALFFDFGVFPLTRIHLDPYPRLMEPRCWLSWSLSEVDAVQPVGGAPAELHAGSDVLRTSWWGRTGLAWLQVRLNANWIIAAVQTEPQSRLVWIFPEPTRKCSQHTWRLMWRRVPKATISWNAVHPTGELLNLLHPVCSPHSPVKAQLQRTDLK